MMTTPTERSKIVQAKLVRRGTLFGGGAAGAGVYGTHKGKGFVYLDNTEVELENDLGLPPPPKGRAFLDLGSAEGQWRCYPI
jgi:hypothetical protein